MSLFFFDQSKKMKTKKTSRKVPTQLHVTNTTLGKMTIDHKQCTRRLRAGVFVDSQYMTEHCYFGYLTHPALEYDVAVAINAEEVQRFSNLNKILLSKESDVQYRFGILTPTEDKSKLEGYTAKAFIDGKMHEMFIYLSQFDQIIYNGHAINVSHESLFFENLVNL
jgi:hypothetical protein